MWVPTVFTKNRGPLLTAEMSRKAIVSCEWQQKGLSGRRQGLGTPGQADVMHKALRDARQWMAADVPRGGTLPNSQHRFVSSSSMVKLLAYCLIADISMHYSQSQIGGDYRTDKDVPQPIADRPRAIVLSGIVPLDAQIGVFPRKTVPDGLSEHLFAHGPVVYAVLDGAKIDALPEILGASGLQHRCLFTGQAAEDHGDAAPWLVELHPEAALLRQLCTRSEARSHHWGAEPLFLRSDAGFDALSRHLRKFTQLRDTGGRWTFFRFWQTDILLDILARDGSILADAFLIPDRIEAVIGLDSDGEGAVLSHSPAEPAPVPRLDGRLGHAITAAMQRRRARQIAGMLRQDFAAELADSYLVMSRGEIVQRGRGDTMEAEGVRGLVAI